MATSKQQSLLNARREQELDTWEQTLIAKQEDMSRCIAEFKSEMQESWQKLQKAESALLNRSKEVDLREQKVKEAEDRLRDRVTRFHAAVRAHRSLLDSQQQADDSSDAADGTSHQDKAPPLVRKPLSLMRQHPQQQSVSKESSPLKDSSDTAASSVPLRRPLSAARPASAGPTRVVQQQQKPSTTAKDSTSSSSSDDDGDLGPARRPLLSAAAKAVPKLSLSLDRPGTATTVRVDPAATDPSPMVPQVARGERLQLRAQETNAQSTKQPNANNQTCPSPEAVTKHYEGKIDADARDIPSVVTELSESYAMMSASTSLNKDPSSGGLGERSRRRPGTAARGQRRRRGIQPTVDPQEAELKERLEDLENEGEEGYYYDDDEEEEEDDDNYPYHGEDDGGYERINVEGQEGFFDEPPYDDDDEEEEEEEGYRVDEDGNIIVDDAVYVPKHYEGRVPVPNPRDLASGVEELSESFAPTPHARRGVQPTVRPEEAERLEHQEEEEDYDDYEEEEYDEDAYDDEDMDEDPILPDEDANIPSIRYESVQEELERERLAELQRRGGITPTNSTPSATSPSSQKDTSPTANDDDGAVLIRPQAEDGVVVAPSMTTVPRQSSSSSSAVMPIPPDMDARYGSNDVDSTTSGDDDVDNEGSSSTAERPKVPMPMPPEMVRYSSNDVDSTDSAEDDKEEDEDGSQQQGNKVPMSMPPDMVRYGSNDVDSTDSEKDDGDASSPIQKHQEDGPSSDEKSKKPFVMPRLETTQLDYDDVADGENEREGFSPVKESRRLHRHGDENSGSEDEATKQEQQEEEKEEDEGEQFPLQPVVTMQLDYDSAPIATNESFVPPTNGGSMNPQPDDDDDSSSTSSSDNDNHEGNTNTQQHITFSATRPGRQMKRYDSGDDETTTTTATPSPTSSTASTDSKFDDATVERFEEQQNLDLGLDPENSPAKRSATHHVPLDLNTVGQRRVDPKPTQQFDTDDYSTASGEDHDDDDDRAAKSATSPTGAATSPHQGQSTPAAASNNSSPQAQQKNDFDDTTDDEDDYADDSTSEGEIDLPGDSPAKGTNDDTANSSKPAPPQSQEQQRPTQNQLVAEAVDCFVDELLLGSDADIRDAINEGRYSEEQLVEDYVSFRQTDVEPSHLRNEVFAGSASSSQQASNTPSPSASGSGAGGQTHTPAAASPAKALSPSALSGSGTSSSVGSPSRQQQQPPVVLSSPSNSGAGGGEKKSFGWDDSSEEDDAF